MYVKPFPKERAKAAGGPERVQAGTHGGTQVAKVARMQLAEPKSSRQKSMARQEVEEQRKVARAKRGHAGHVAKHTLQPRVKKKKEAATRSCRPLLTKESDLNKEAIDSKEQLQACGLCWKRAITNSGKKVISERDKHPKRFAEKTSPAEAQTRSSVVAVTTQEGIDGYRENAMRIESVEQVELGSIMELSVSSRVLKRARQSKFSG